MKLSSRLDASSLPFFLLRENFVKDSVTAGDDKADGGELGNLAILVSFEKNRVNMSFEVVHRDEGLVERVRERLAVGDADEKRPDKARALRNADSIKVGKIEASLQKSFADNGDNLAQMFARGEFGNNATVFAVNVYLRGDNARENFAAVGDNGGSGFIARGFDSKYANAHTFMLAHALVRTSGCRLGTRLAESD